MARRDNGGAHSGHEWDNLFTNLSRGLTAVFEVIDVVANASESENADERIAISRPRYNNLRSLSYEPYSIGVTSPTTSTHDEDTIVISIDATVDRAGGLLRLPNSEEIYFYSIDWSQVYSFPDPQPSEKAKMVNAFLALEVFKEYVRTYRNITPRLAGNRMVCKVDNPFGKSAKFREFYKKINAQLCAEPFKGKWVHTGGQTDTDVKLVDKLSRDDYSTGGDLPFLLNGNYYEYTTHNISLSDFAVLHTLPLEVPKEFLVVKDTASDWGPVENITTAVAVGAAVVGGGYLLYKGIEYLFNEANASRTGDSTHNQYGAYGIGNSLDGLESSSDAQDGRDTTIVIAVDATKERAGGILRFPRTKTIYFYSIDWSNRFNFLGASDKFEMANVLLALEVFEKFVSNYRLSYSDLDRLVCKNDNTIWLSEKPNDASIKDSECRQLFQNINDKLTSRPFSGQWKYTRKPTDEDLKVTDKLSRQECLNSDSLPVLPNFNYCGYNYDYSVRNISSSTHTTDALGALANALSVVLNNSDD